MKKSLRASGNRTPFKVMGVLFFIFLCAIPIFWAIQAKKWTTAILFIVITIVFLLNEV